MAFRIISSISHADILMFLEDHNKTQSYKLHNHLTLHKKQSTIFRMYYHTNPAKVIHGRLCND